MWAARSMVVGTGAGRAGKWLVMAGRAYGTGGRKWRRRRERQRAKSQGPQGPQGPQGLQVSQGSQGGQGGARRQRLSPGKALMGGRRLRASAVDAVPADDRSGDDAGADRWWEWKSSRLVPAGRQKTADVSGVGSGGASAGRWWRLVHEADVEHVKVIQARDAATARKSQSVAKVGDSARLAVAGYLGPVPLSQLSTPLDQSLDLEIFMPRQEVEVVIGARQGAVKGWDLGVRGMTVGENRRLVVPPAYAYGEHGSPSLGVPPDTELAFDIELVELTKEASTRDRSKGKSRPRETC